MRAALVNGDRLAELAKTLDVGAYLQLGEGAKKSGDNQRRSILADAMEAIIGAVYLDANFKTVQTCILNWYGKQVEDFSSLTAVKDSKSALQEWEKKIKK